MKRKHPMKRKLVASDEAAKGLPQHRKPCADCPWARTALRGWLGGTDANTWVQAAHGEDFILCHTSEGTQCAGAAIYRANVHKAPRDPKQLRLRPDPSIVFDSAVEFLHHHTYALKPNKK